MKVVIRLLLLIGCVLSTVALGQGYPSKPIRMIVPYPAGGGTDIAARWVGQKLGDLLNQPVIIDNRPGANGNIGTDLIAKSAADGYTIGMATPGPVTVGRSLYPKLPYDPEKDLAPIILANDSPIVLVVNPNVSAKSLQELVALAKRSPGKLTAALVSTGSVPHLLTELLKSAAEINILDVPYKGGSPAATDVMGGQVDMLFRQAAGDRGRQRKTQRVDSGCADHARSGIPASRGQRLEWHRRTRRHATGHREQAQRRNRQSAAIPRDPCALQCDGHGIGQRIAGSLRKIPSSRIHEVGRGGEIGQHHGRMTHRK
jgi:Tripartite tricarboxylate transporter family receptor